jgi:hypothetical protein
MIRAARDPDAPVAGGDTAFAQGATTDGGGAQTCAADGSRRGHAAGRTSRGPSAWRIPASACAAISVLIFRVEPPKELLTRRRTACAGAHGSLALGDAMTRRASISLYSLALTSFVAALVLAGPARAADDPFQRNITFKNELSIPIYPVIQAPENVNCMGPHASRRIFVNENTKGAGIPPGATTKVRIPKGMPCWYLAARIFIFTANVEQFEALLPENLNIRTIPDNIAWTPPLCAGDANACWSGYADADYGRDAPTQLLEYTIISQDPNTGMAFPDGNNPNGIPFVDFDVSYVDDAYLPVAMSIKDGGATEYMGTIDNFADFTQGLQRYLVKAKGRTQWSQYAAFSDVNWPNNLFHTLVAQTGRIPSGQILVQETLTGGTSSLYKPTWDGVTPKACSATPACQGLVGNCCPNDQGDFLGCCNQQAYMIDNVTKSNGKFSNPSLTSITARWTQWLGNNNPCGMLDDIGPWPSEDAAFDKLQFCRMFRRTVRNVWAAFENDPTCVGTTGTQKDQCVTAAIIGYKSMAEGELNESVQAVQRSVPWGNKNKGEKQYQDDKFVLYWAPYGSVFNLNPFARFVHYEIDAPGAYSFSIDDRYGNFGGRGSGILINVGGSSLLDNKDPFDPYTQFRVGWGPGWHHAKVCGRSIDIPNQTGSSVKFSFWKDGVKQPTCDIFLYADAAETSFVTFRLGEETRNVTDTYTGLQPQIRSLTLPDANYCAANSTMSLVTAGKCSGNLSFPTSGAEAYVAVSDAEKPRVTWNIPALN